MALNEPPPARRPKTGDRFTSNAVNNGAAKNETLKQHWQPASTFSLLIRNGETMAGGFEAGTAAGFVFGEMTSVLSGILRKGGAMACRVANVFFLWAF